MSNHRLGWWIGGLIGLIAIGAIFYLLSPYFAGDKIVSALWLDWAGLKLHWYGLFLALGVVIGWWWLEKASLRLSWHPQVVNLVIVTVLGGIIGARLLFVILKFPDFVGQWPDIFNITTGGLSIHGSLLGGSGALWWYCRRYKLPIWSIIDQMAPGVVLGQMIGRWGNFFNQEAFGGPTNLPWKMYIDAAHRPLGWEATSFFHPTFLYEIIGLSILLGGLLYWRQRQPKVGTLVLIYLSGYALLRFFIEFYRIDSDYWGSFTVAQWGSLVIMVGAIIGLILRYRR